MLGAIKNAHSSPPATVQGNEKQQFSPSSPQNQSVHLHYRSYYRLKLLIHLFLKMSIDHPLLGNCSKLILISDNARSHSPVNTFGQRKAVSCSPPRRRLTQGRGRGRGIGSRSPPLPRKRFQHAQDEDKDEDHSHSHSGCIHEKEEGSCRWGGCSRSILPKKPLRSDSPQVHYTTRNLSMNTALGKKPPRLPPRWDSKEPEEEPKVPVVLCSKTA